MGKNQYFNFFDDMQSQELYHDLINEMVDIFGVNAKYIPRDSESANGMDMIFGDDPTKTFVDSYPVCVYIQDTEEFQGGELFSKFGLQINKSFNLLLPLREFSNNVPTTVGSRPKEGDLLWLPNFKVLFEIKYADEEYFFYSFGSDKFYGFNLSVEYFRYNNEKIEIEEVVDVLDMSATTYQMNLAANGTSTFTTGEAVYQGASLLSANASAVVVSWDKPSRVLHIRNVSGSFGNSSPLIGANSGASWNIATYDTTDDKSTDYDNNEQLFNEAEGLVSDAE